jgi:hypothetical protein
MTYFLGTLDEFWDILHGNGGSLAQSVWPLLESNLSFNLSFVGMFYRSAALVVSLLGLTTIGLFLYVLFLPLITGEEPDVRIS